jgi:hypothetical protein
MKTRISSLIILLSFIMTGLVISCKKDSANNSNDNSNATNLSTQADDQSMASDENENITNDVNVALTSSASTNGNAAQMTPGQGQTAVNSLNQTNGVAGAQGTLICDATITIDTSSNPRTLTITYDGTNCWGNRTRSGTVVISIAAGTHWMDKGAVVTVNVQNLKITRIRDSKTIIINGTRTLTNVSGGSLKNLASLGTITHTITDTMQITFADNLTRSWQSAKQRVFTYNNGIVLTITGTHSDGTNSGIAEWGINRFGIAFTTIVMQPVVIRQDCDFRIVSGQLQILRSDNLTSTITFGLDATGNTAGCPGTGNYYLQVAFTGANGRTYPIILPY